jgi:hypothetical protein
VPGLPDRWKCQGCQSLMALGSRPFRLEYPGRVAGWPAVMLLCAKCADRAHDYLEE